MKKYIIYALHHYGIFYGIEENHPKGYVLIRGKFNNEGEEMVFIKNRHDKELEG